MNEESSENHLLCNIEKKDIRNDVFYSVSLEETKVNQRQLSVFERKRLDRIKKEEIKLEEIHPELKVKLEDKTNDVRINYINIKTRLLPFQIFGVKWMRNQEFNVNKGGILADEMGLGKTLQSLSLVASFGAKGSKNLIICPVVAINQWLKEIEKHLNSESISASIFYGPSTKKEKNFCPEKINIYISSFGKIESVFRRSKKLKLKENEYKDFELIFDTKFERIIIDEAHIIKDYKSSTARAISEINSHYKWLLTGTPVQNRISDLYSLTRFLRLDPLSFYFCKKCDCKSFYWLNRVPKNLNKNINKTENKFELVTAEEAENNYRKSFCTCGHFSSLHFSYFNRYITSYVKTFGFTEISNDVFDELKKITKSLVLRRTKKEVEKEIGLPSKNVSIKRLYFSLQEKLFYESLYKETKEILSSNLKYNDVYSKNLPSGANNYISILGLIQKMRMAVNHPILVTKDFELNTIVCGFCNEEADDPIFSGCKHVFCREEIRNYILENDKCPICKIKLSIDLNQNIENIEDLKKLNKFNINTDSWHSSTKLEFIIQEVTKITKAEHKNFVPKILIFSQFVNFLELIRWRLERAGYGCVKIYGSTSMNQRRSAIQTFNENTDVNIFLISLKAGGLALNLVSASHVIISDLWWNPAVEDQAMDRIHRIGQFRPIRIIKVVIEDSIESRVLELQKKKKALFDSTIDGDNRALNQLGEEDLMFLFN